MFAVKRIGQLLASIRRDVADPVIGDFAKAGDADLRQRIAMTALALTLVSQSGSQPKLNPLIKRRCYMLLRWRNR